jgi:hypothetical protein
MTTPKPHECVKEKAFKKYVKNAFCNRLEMVLYMRATGSGVSKIAVRLRAPIKPRPAKAGAMTRIAVSLPEERVAVYM